MRTKSKNKTSNYKITAIYVRRSVSDKDKDNNSLSIDAQKAECIKYVGENENYRIYCDDGKSGKNAIHRPAFMQMMSDAKEGLIARIIVKKYDRFSRNMREYLNITNELDNLGISVFSLTEPFNTATKEGRMMRNNLLNFAEFERETIAARTADAYNTKARETGFYQGGPVYYGFVPERRTINGKTGSVLVPSEQADAVKIAFDMYQHQGVSLADVLNYYREHNINCILPTRKMRKTNLLRGQVSNFLCNPIYVRADKNVYQYFASQGYEMLDDIDAYDSVHGLYRHTNADGSKFIKVGYHEGYVDADAWLAVQDKKAKNNRFRHNTDAINSWLVGLIKCAHCGYGIHLSYRWIKKHTVKVRFYTDYGARHLEGCVKSTLKTSPESVEDAVFNAMKERIEQLEIAKKETAKPDSKTESIKANIIRLDEEIHKLMDKLADADDVLFDYINKRVKELHNKKAKFEESLRNQARKHKKIDTSPLTDPLKNWDDLSTREKHDVAMTMIDVIYLSDETGIDIHFSI